MKMNIRSQLCSIKVPFRHGPKFQLDSVPIIWVMGLSVLSRRFRNSRSVFSDKTLELASRKRYEEEFEESSMFVRQSFTHVTVCVSQSIWRTASVPSNENDRTHHRILLYRSSQPKNFFLSKGCQRVVLHSTNKKICKIHPC